MSFWITWLGAVLACTVATAFVPGEKVLKCMSCHKAPSFIECDDMKICDIENEVCYVEEEIDVGGETVINAGCRLKEHCDSIGCYGESIKRRRRDVNIMPDFTTREITCHHCCDNDFCNMYGCPNKYDVTKMRSNKCLVCDQVVHPLLCNNVENCDENESCFIKQIMQGSEKRYHLGCMQSRMCDMLALLRNQSNRRKRFVPVWSDCCNEHMCNGDLPLLDKPPSMYSNTYVCPVLDGNTHWVNNQNTGQEVVTREQSSQPTPQPTPQPEHRTTIPPITEPPCEDLEDCSLYGYDYACNGGFDEWARSTCRRFCGYCTDVHVTEAWDTGEPAASHTIH